MGILEGIGSLRPSCACCDNKMYRKYVRNPISLSVAFKTGKDIRILCAISARVGYFLVSLLEV